MSKKQKLKFSVKTERRTSGGGAGYIKLPENLQMFIIPEKTKKAKIDILPYFVSDRNHPHKEDFGVEQGSLYFCRPFKVHRNIGSDNKSYICRSSIGKKCPICEAQAEIFKSGDKEMAISLYPKQRYLYLVVPIGFKDIEEVPHIWDMAESLFHKTLSEMLEASPEDEDFCDLEDGKTLTMFVSWESIKEKQKPWPEIKHITFDERDAQYSESDIEDLDLDEVILNSTLSYDDLNAKFMESDSEEYVEDDDDDDKKKEEKPKRKKEGVDFSKRTKQKSFEWDDVPEDFDELVDFVADNNVDIDTDDYDPDDEDSVEMFRADVAKLVGAEKPKKSPRQEKAAVPAKGARPDNGKVRSTERTSVSKEREPQSKIVASGGKNKCPFGHVFGKDNNKHDDCDSCDVWDDCIVAKKK